MRTAIGALVLATLVTVGISGHASGWKGGPADLFTLWAIAPYGGFLLLCLATRKRRPASGISALGAVLASALGIFSFIDGFFIHLSSCSPLLFIWVPIWQWAGWLFFALLVAVASAAPKGKRPSP